MKDLNAKELADLLRSIAASIEVRDSFEGSLEYYLSDVPGIYEVRAAIRTDNRNGQGGMILIGHNTKQEQKEAWDEYNSLKMQRSGEPSQSEPACPNHQNDSQS